MKVLDKPTFLEDRDTKDDSDLSNGRDWPTELCVICPAPDKYAANVADTVGLEPDPQKDIHGLAVFINESSAKEYMKSLNGLSGEVVPKTLAECKEIALSRPKIQALFLMAGPKIKELLYVR